MTRKNNTDAVEKLLQLQQKFKSKLPERISAIETAWLRIRDGKTTDFSDLHLSVHSLVGGAGTFGASMVSTGARALENQLKSLLNNELTFDSEMAERIDYMLLEIKGIAEKWQPSSIPFVPENKKRKVEERLDWQANIYLVEDDVEVANQLITFLEKSGYKVFYYRKIKEFEKEFNTNEKASAIIMDMSFNEGVVAGAETIQTLSKQNKTFPPVLFITVHEDIEARLAAARAGAKRYFTKPIDKEKLLSSLDKLTNRVEEEAYRVLLIDDEQEVLDFYSITLQEQGMEVLSCVDATEGFRSIEYFKPELIVLDLYMEKCSGFDLAKVIRQDDERASIPIVFLSSELDVATQLSAMDLGGDDFLIKPVDAEYFSQAILSRVKRARNVNSLNHRIKDALRESEFRLITLDQHSIISMADTAGTITFVNQHFLDISGYKEEELIGKNHRVIKSGKHPDSFYEDIWTTISSGKIWNGQICNKAKNDVNYWVEATIVPFMDENNIPYKYVSVRTDITEIKISEEDAQESEKRLLEQQQTLNTLSTVTDYVLLEESAFFDIVTQRAADTLNIERVSIWLLSENNKEIICRKLYEQKDERWSSGLILERDNYPKYFSEISTNKVIPVSNTHTHIATSEFSKDYLTPLGIGAMLDVPIRRQGHLIGVICCEHVGGKRLWRSDEQSFVVGLADLVSLNIESSERKAAEIKLAEAVEEADSANNAKSDFLSNMSHELRTPMNAISGFAQLLLLNSENKLDDTQTGNVEEIIKASNHLLELINEILNLAKIESGNVDLSIETVSYFEVMHECIALIDTMINKCNLKTYLTFNGENISIESSMSIDVYMHVDRMRLKQIFLNLLSNAVKYNKDEGSITIACDVSNNIVHISIIDTGKGISTEGKKELFKSFSRLGEEGGNIEGSGIGLIITKKLVELMGGKIGVDSEAGVGSTFWVEFPLVSPTNKRKIKNSDSEKNITPDENIEHTVLYVEDNPANLRLVNQLLLSKGNIRMISAHEPNLGLELAMSELPDLILLDINLPGMSGYDVLKKLRVDELTKNIPVFAVSANAMITDIEKGMTAGFNDYITKPIDITSFITSVSKELNKK